VHHLNILVTGGAGFIGSHIVDEYIGLGHAVWVLDNLSTGKRQNVNSRAIFREVDIRDTGKVDEIFRTHKFDVVNHHAAQMDVRRSVADPLYDASVNILGVLNVLECCIKYAVGRFIFASSGGAIYGEQEYFPADENHPTRPVSPYGVAKLSTESYLNYYSIVHGLESISLRYANVYGPRQNPEGEAGVVAIFASRMLSGTQPLINGDGRQTRDYVYVADVVRANVLALNHSGTHVFNIGTGVETDVNSLFHHLATATGSRAVEQHGHAKKGEQMRSVLSFAKIEKVWGWRPKIGLKDGIVRTVEYFRQQKANGS
jgi:UDP-glucose 4-epimerase